MKQSLFAIRDLKVCAYKPPFTARNEKEAQRMVADAARFDGNRGNILADYPEDFDLMFVGEFDDLAGVLIPVQPECIINVKALVGQRPSFPVELGKTDRQDETPKKEV